MKYDKRKTMVIAECHQIERQAHKDITVWPQPPYPPVLHCAAYSSLPKLKCLWEVNTLNQFRTPSHDSATNDAYERQLPELLQKVVGTKGYGEARECMLKDIDGNIS